MSTKRVYVKKTLISVEEDEFNEFKGHRSIGIEDLPPWCFQPNSNKRTRKPISRTLNAFLNSGRGGTIYLGIIDDGVIKGFYLTEYQKDHIKLAIKDLFSRYEPKVEEDKYNIEFVPLIERNSNGVYSAVKEPEKCESVDSHLKAHLLRTYDLCWCDKDLARRIDESDRPQDYVVEIKIYKQKTTFKVYNDGSFKADLPITYQNEENMCFFRTSASCKEYTVKECSELAIQQLRDLYDPVVASMQDELSSYYMLEKGSEVASSDYINTGIFENVYHESNVCNEIKDYLKTTGLSKVESC